jgi:hypothetical protein
LGHGEPSDDELDVVVAMAAQPIAPVARAEAAHEEATVRGATSSELRSCEIRTSPTPGAATPSLSIGKEQRSPNVVARLMGLDALPHGQAATVAGDGDHVVPAELVRVAKAAAAGFLRAAARREAHGKLLELRCNFGSLFF